MSGFTTKETIKSFVMSTHKAKPYIFENRRLRGEYKHPGDLDNGHQRSLVEDIAQEDL